MARSTTRRQSLYFPEDMLQDLDNEAKRLDRPISWLIQQAWNVARHELRKYPSTTDFFPPYLPDENSPSVPG